MKTLSTLAASGALTGFIALPVRFEISLVAFLAFGLGLTLLHDYRPRRPLQLPVVRPQRPHRVFRAPALRVSIEPHRLAA